jgi:hypothetical protein
MYPIKGIERLIFPLVPLGTVEYPIKGIERLMCLVYQQENHYTYPIKGIESLK